MLLPGRDAAAACGLPSISSFHAGSKSAHAVGYQTSSPVPPVSTADVQSSVQTGAALGLALASVCTVSQFTTVNYLDFKQTPRNIRWFRYTLTTRQCRRRHCVLLC